VAVEKLFQPKIAKNKIALGSVLSDLLEFQGISRHPDFDHFGRNRSFSTATRHFTNYNRMRILLGT